MEKAKSHAMSVTSPIPEGVDIDSLKLSVEEIKAYPRWYTDLLLRKGKQSVAVGDVLSFLDNFGVTDPDKQLILGMYVQPLVTLDPAQFYIFLRFASHLLEGVSELTPELGFINAPVPRPKSILSRKRKSTTSSSSRPKPPTNPFRKPNENANSPFGSRNRSDSGSHSKMDIDMFKTFILTGNRPSSDDESRMVKRKKRVTFDSRPPEVAEAAARSMDELLRQRGTTQTFVTPQIPTLFDNNSSISSVVPNTNSSGNSNNNNFVNTILGPQIVIGDDDDYNNINNNSVSATEQEDEEEDVEIDENAFKNVNIDSVLHHGVSIQDTDFSRFNSPSPGISPSPSPDLRTQGSVGLPLHEQRTGPPPPPPRSRLGVSFTEGDRNSPEISSITSGTPVTRQSPSPSLPENFLSIQNQHTSQVTNGFHPSANIQILQAQPSQTAQPMSISHPPPPASTLSVSSQLRPPSQSGLGGGGSISHDVKQFPQSSISSNTTSMQQQFLRPNITGSSYQRPAPSIPLGVQNGSYSSIPPPPQPRRAVSSNASFITNQQIISGATRQYNGPPLPPPPPPPPPARNRAPSLPPHPTATLLSQNPMHNLNTAATSSEPNLVADLRTLQEEVNRLSRK